MLRLNYLSLWVASLLICSGCSSVSSPYAVNCDNCSTQPFYSVMIIQPGMSSDFPVSYRVRLTEGDARLSKIMPMESVSSRVVPQWNCRWIHSHARYFLWAHLLLSLLCKRRRSLVKKRYSRPIHFAMSLSLSFPAHPQRALSIRLRCLLLSN